MNSSTIRPVALPLAVTLALMACLMPLASLLHGGRGVNFVLLASGVVAAIVLISTTTQALLPELSSEPLKRLALVGSLRMVLSLAAVLAAWVATRDFPHPEVLLYAVPLYVGLLTSESIDSICQNHQKFVA